MSVHLDRTKERRLKPWQANIAIGPREGPRQLCHRLLHNCQGRIGRVWVGRVWAAPPRCSPSLLG